MCILGEGKAKGGKKREKSGSQKHSQDTFQKGIFEGVVCMCKSVQYG